MAEDSLTDWWWGRLAATDPEEDDREPDNGHRRPFADRVLDGVAAGSLPARASLMDQFWVDFPT